MCGQLNHMHEVCQRQWCAATNEGLLLKRMREVGTVKAGAGAAAGNLHHWAEQSAVLLQPHKASQGELWLWEAGLQPPTRAGTLVPANNMGRVAGAVAGHQPGVRIYHLLKCCWEDWKARQGWRNLQLQDGFYHSVIAEVDFIQKNLHAFFHEMENSRTREIQS